MAAARLSMDCIEEGGPMPPTNTPPRTPRSQQAAGCSPIEEYKQVEPLIAAPLKAGSSYFLVNRRWYTEWLQWVGHPSVQSPHMRPSADPLLPTSPEGLEAAAGTNSPQNSAKRTRTRSWTKDRPGEIDNNGLLEEGTFNSIKRTLNERSDYEIVPEDAWELLIGWYGGGPQIKRRAIALPSGSVQVELFGLTLKVYKSSDTAGVPLEVMESKCTPIKDLKATLCREMGLDEAKVRIWDYFNNKAYEMLEKDMDRTLENAKIFDKNPILLEEQNADGSWPQEDQNESTDIIGTSTYAGYSSSSMYSGSHSADVPSVGEPAQRGAVGLQNLGNTCFMNSSLQCLSNIPALRDYFLSDQYKESLNRSAHKTKGKLAEAFSELLGLMWKEDTTRVAPRNFKWQVGQFAEQFSGYGQQDSMELIEYVVDGLKEDCNRVQGAKPYVELKEAEGRPDSEVAAEALEAYSKRSDSKVDDLFVGLFKSVVRCPEKECGRMSVTFDPFLSAKLPLASSAEQRQSSFSITVVRNTLPASGSFVGQIKVKVNKDASVKALVEAAVKECGEGLEVAKCILVEVFNKKVHKFWEDTESVETIGSEDMLVLFEVADAKAFQRSTQQRWGTSTFGSFGASAFSGCSGETANGDASPSSSSSCGVILYHRQGGSNLGMPLLLSIPKDATARELYSEVEKRIKELFEELGAGDCPAWKIFKVAKNSSYYWSEGERIDPQSDETLGMKESREYFAIQWEADGALPSRLSQDNLIKSSSGTTSNGEVALAQLLQMFVEDEQLGRDDAWYCNKCKEHKEAWKKLEFHHAPPVLVLQLKRFQYTRWSRERLNTPVNFPLENLDLGPFRTASSKEGPDPQPSVYDLAGMSKHIGSLGGGHYVAYCRSSEDGAWYHFDDGSVRRCTVEEVEADKVGAYVLFYIRRDYRPAQFGPPRSP